MVDVNVTTRSKIIEEQVFKDREPRKAKSVVDWEKKEQLKWPMVEIIQHSQKNINLDKCAIHIHGRMEHNLAKHAKYYYCACIKILGSSQFIRETNHNKRDFFGHW